MWQSHDIPSQKGILKSGGVVNVVLVDTHTQVGSVEEPSLPDPVPCDGEGMITPET